MMELSVDGGSYQFAKPFFPPTYKIVLVGNYGVGKTTLLWRYLHKEFRSVETRVTVVDIERKKVTARNREVELEFWDTAGQERFRTISPSYYSGAHGIIVIYNTTDRESYTEVKHYWMKEIFGLFGDDADQKMPIMLIGTKADLIHGCCDDEQEVVRKRDVMELKKEHSRLLGPYECSAKTGKNIEKAFSRLVDDLVIRETIGIPKPDHPKPPKPCGMC